MLTLGYKASAEQFGPKELLDLGIEAERAGFDSVFVSDHFQPWRHTDGHAPNCFAWLGALAARTERITIGTSVLTPTFRYHPAVVAQALATIGCLAEGRRVVLGVGTGESLNEVPLGVEWPDQKERFARLKEATELIRQLWTGEFVTFDGQFYKTKSATIYDRPKDPVELWIAASGPAAARLAGRTADGFICTSGKGMELYSETLLPAVAEGAEKAGRPVDGIEKMIESRTPGSGPRSLCPARRRWVSRIRARWSDYRQRCRPRRLRRAGLSRTTPTSTSSSSAPISSSASPISSSTPRPTTSRASSRRTRGTSFPVCARPGGRSPPCRGASKPRPSPRSCRPTTGSRRR